jgi:hypothetical protein
METTGLRVSREHIERLWTSVGDDTSDPHAGIFGPSSISWKVNRESALFLGAGRAALLQLAHPWVTAALHQHSNLQTDPLARFHNTFRVVFTMVFGTLEQALASSRHPYQLHTRIKGQLPESVAAYPQGAPYEANELKALVWVYATLVESALLAYNNVLQPLSSNEREIYYAESKTIEPFSAFRRPPYLRTGPDSKLTTAPCGRQTCWESMHSRGRWRTMSYMGGDLGCRFRAGIAPLPLHGYQSGSEMNFRCRTASERKMRWQGRQAGFRESTDGCLRRCDLWGHTRKQGPAFLAVTWTR